jgi:hypothetical protein
MTKLKLRTLIFLLSIAIAAVACKKDKETKNDLKGTYTRVMEFSTGTSAVDLQFTEDGWMLWTLIDEVPGHSSSTVKYRLEGEDKFVIYDDEECNFEEGVFSYVISGNTLTVTVVTDACTPRGNAIVGNWTKK